MMLCAKYVGNSWYNLNRVLVAFRSHFAVMEQNQDGQVVYPNLLNLQMGTVIARLLQGPAPNADLESIIISSNISMALVLVVYRYKLVLLAGV
jgi:hypothetical protein